VLVTVVVDSSGSTARSVSTRPNRASADQSLGAPRCCTACIMSTNAVPEPDRGSAVPQHRPSCLHLLIAAIASWATPYLADVIAALRAEGAAVACELVTSLTHRLEPVSFLGQFAFDPATAHPLGDRSRLRSGSDDGDESA